LIDIVNAICIDVVCSRSSLPEHDTTKAGHGLDGFKNFHKICLVDIVCRRRLSQKSEIPLCIGAWIGGCKAVPVIEVYKLCRLGRDIIADVICRSAAWIIVILDKYVVKSDIRENFAKRSVWIDALRSSS